MGRGTPTPAASGGTKSLFPTEKGRSRRCWPRSQPKSQPLQWQRRRRNFSRQPALFASITLAWVEPHARCSFTHHVKAGKVFRARKGAAPYRLVRQSHLVVKKMSMNPFLGKAIEAVKHDPQGFIDYVEKLVLALNLGDCGPLFAPSRRIVPRRCCSATSRTPCLRLRLAIRQASRLCKTALRAQLDR
jgi:hypothetical protein